MHAMNVTQARAKLFQLIANVNFNSEPITLTNSKGKNAVLIGQDDWNAIQEHGNQFLSKSGNKP